jgi:pyruvate,water dikinase
MGADGRYVVGLAEIDRTDVALAGGKGAQLRELSRVDGIFVPSGFCVTTRAFRQACAEEPSLDEMLDRLSRLGAEDREETREASAEIREAIRARGIPGEAMEEIARAVRSLGGPAGLAVRSSATAEDLPAASFAGQHETYLNVIGADAVLDRVCRCWASLFTERAVAYRRRNGVDHRDLQMAVVVQEMVSPQAAGVLFTADPASSNRRVAVVEASLGLGEALVSGLVSPDVYAVRDSQVISRVLARKLLAVEASPSGGTRQVAVGDARAGQPALTDAQAVALVALGRQLEAHFGAPQDIEWCLADGTFAIVQSRPITTLYPIPVREDAERHVYVSVGHQQMMTDPMKALGLSLFQLTALRPMHEAGGRLFVDVAGDLASPVAGSAIVGALGRSDPLIGDALEAVLERGFIQPIAEGGRGVPAILRAAAPLEPDPAIVSALIARNEASLATLQGEIRTRSGAALVDFILADIPELKRLLSDPDSSHVIRAVMSASSWLEEHLDAWLGDSDAAGKLALSVPGNITSEMGLDLLDLADAIRPHPQVVEVLESAGAEDLLDALTGVPGGIEAREAIRGYLDRYGMRCAGEIDITRPRWSEAPGTLAAAILSNVRGFAPGAARRRFEQGRREAAATETQVLERLRALPAGGQKAEETKRTIDCLRAFAGYREYPKYAIVSRYFIYKQALMAEADRLLAAGALGEREDIFHLTLEELRGLVRAKAPDAQLIAERKEAYRLQQALTPPRVLTSEGEVFAGSYRRELPAGALAGLAVCGGIVEGRARIVLDIADAELQPGDILVTAYTDPSWSPLFPAVDGLVTEVGGLMTHGAVIAREYGLPTVVGVEHATQLIQDGCRIRVHGGEGYVEVLSQGPARSAQGAA